MQGENFEKQIQEVIEKQIRMEKDSAHINRIRAGRIRSIASCGDGRWRVDTDTRFFIRDTLDEAIAAAEAETTAQQQMV